MQEEEKKTEEKSSLDLTFKLCELFNFTEIYET